MNMNKYKSLILIGLFAVGFSSCQTDDLQKDIDALKERVEDFEMQVQRLNDEMNIIRVLLDGNKTISSYTQNGDKYTLTLSNGETIELTQGQDGKNYPSISIGSNGNWFINGNDTGNKAEAEDGKETEVTPQFKIIDRTWWVSYNGIEGEYENLGVQATGEASGVSPIYNFEAKENEFVFKLSETSEDTFSIPVVEGLTCQILGEKDYYDNIRAEQTFKVKVNLKAGDLVRAVVPTEWKAVVSDYSNLTGEHDLTITVTPPTTASKCVLSVEVTRGVNIAADEVTLRTATTSYYDDYMAGFDIQIGDLIINKYNFPKFKLVESDNLEYTEGTVLYFVKGNVSWNATGNGNIIIMAADKGAYPKVTATSRVTLNATEDNLGFICHGISFESSFATNSTFSLSGKAVLNRFYFSDCKIKTVSNQHFTYLDCGADNVETTKINNILFKSCLIGIPSMDVSTTVLNFLNLRRGYFDNTEMYDNVFYCSDVDKAVLVNVVMNYNGQGFFNKVQVYNNTFINILGNHGGNASGLLRITMNEDCNLKRNLFWYNAECIGKPNDNPDSSGIEYKSHLMSGASFFSSESFGNNIVYSAGETQLTWQYFRSAPTTNVEAGFNNNITLETVNPFTNGTVANEGKFTYTDEFKAKGIGADIQ